MVQTADKQPLSSDAKSLIAGITAGSLVTLILCVHQILATKDFTIQLLINNTPTQKQSVEQPPKNLPLIKDLK